MFAASRYLAWASRYYGRLRFDLAASGMPAVPVGELGTLASSSLGDAGGWSALRDAIATYTDAPREETIATLGATHAVWLACASLTAPGDEVLVEEPAYEPLVRIAEGVGARVVRFARPRDERFALDPDRVARAMTARTKLVIVSDLHNPSGVRAGERALRAVAQVAAGRGAIVLVDEVYGAFDDLVDDRGVFRRSARKLAWNVVCASSLTKCYGLGPQRVGWLTGPPEVIARAEDAMVASAGALPLAHAHLAVRAFERIGALADRARGILVGKRARVARWTGTMGLPWSAPDAGLFGFVHVPGAGDLTSVIEAAARDRQVLVAPGAFFGVPDGFRVAWSAPLDVLDEGLARLGEALRAPSGKQGRGA
jgi:aspartate/methionine/tyrosine aminotransferase